MTRRRPALTLLMSALLACVWLGAGRVPAVSASPLMAQTYGGASYSPDLMTVPTKAESQSKLWFHDGGWWALLADPTGRTLRVDELMADHTWHPTPAVVSTDAADTGDVLQDGDTVHVVTRHSDGSLVHVPLTYVPASRSYQVGAAVTVSTRVSQAPASIAKDVAGRLWVSFATAATVLISFSDDGGQTWSPNNALFYASTGLTAQVSGLVAFDDKVGLLWSDQPGNAFKFAWHAASDSPYTWQRETVLTGQAQADEHIDLVRIPGTSGDTVAAAIKMLRKSDQNPPDATMIQLLVRNPAGAWSSTPVATVFDAMDNPVLQVDTTTQSLYVLGSSNGGIVAKRASLSDLKFPSGPGDAFMLDPAGSASGSLNDPNVSKEPVTAASGMVVLASDTHLHVYRHGEFAITPPHPVVDPTDHTPPTTPGALQGHAVSPTTVVLSWTAANDGTRWVPAEDGVPVAGYVVTRNGTRVATVTTTSFQDQPRRDTEHERAATVEYLVRAVDAAGNQSAPARVVVQLPATPSRTPDLLGLGLLAAAALVSVVVGGRRLVLRRVLLPRRTTRTPPPEAAAAEKVPERVGG